MQTGFPCILPVLPCTGLQCKTIQLCFLNQVFHFITLLQKPWFYIVIQKGSQLQRSHLALSYFSLSQQYSLRLPVAYFDPAQLTQSPLNKSCEIKVSSSVVSGEKITELFLDYSGRVLKNTPKPQGPQRVRTKIFTVGLWCHEIVSENSFQGLKSFFIPF